MILVAGATGLVGGMITRRLVDQGRQVRIVVRPGSSYDALVQAGAEPVFADLTDRDSLDRACAGAEAVITTATASSRPGQETVEAVDRAGNANLVSVAAASGVQRFVLVSTLGADPASPVEIFRAKGEAEQRLQETAMRWTALRPNMMMEIWVPLVVGDPALAHRPVHLVGGGQRRHSLVSARDVAAYAVASLDHPDADRRVLVLGGPAAVTWRDVVAAFEAELGHAIDVRTVEPGEPVPGVRDFVVGLMAATESYDSPIDMAGPSRPFRHRADTAVAVRPRALRGREPSEHARRLGRRHRSPRRRGRSLAVSAEPCAAGQGSSDAADQRTWSGSALCP
jgi:uncharacterized protein YbjT (DUF2867 family)